jgi:predicted phage-related endonuclease
MARRVTIKASDVAACIGLNPFKPSTEVRDDLWKKYWPETFMGRTKREEAQEVLGRSANSQKVLEKAVAFKAKNSTEVQSNYEKAKKEIENGDLSPEDREKVIEYLRSSCYTTYGTRSEDKTAEKITEDTGVTLLRDNAIYTLPLLETEDGTTFFVTGKVDRIEVDTDGRRTLIEIKNRTRGLFNKVREYENVQIQVYLRMLGLTRAKLIEQYNNTTNTNTITRDEEIWDNEIWPAVLDFAIDLHARATGQIAPSA